MNKTASPEVVVVGAGVSGLALAGGLGEAGIPALVLERARGVGGRCATRRVEGSPVDHGVPFLHGRHPRFLAALAAAEAEATPLPGWPARRIGGGIPCQPEAFEGRDHLVAFREGVTRFPKRLARGLDVRLGADVASLRPVPGEPLLEISLREGPLVRAATVALTMPVPSAERLLEPLERSSPALVATRPIRRQVRTLPCLTVIARYDDAMATPEWDVCYPVDATMVHAIIHDSRKREPRTPLTLVVQGRPRFSREYLDAPTAEWSRELLWEAGEFVGDWVERPVLRQEHIWRQARVEPTTELAAPMLIRLENGARLALCGDGFSPSAGLEGAYLSGRSLAERIQTDRGAPVTSPQKETM